MKKSLFFTALSAFIISTATSQVIQKTVPAVKQNVIIKTVPAAPPPPPPTTNKTAGTANQNTLVYSLTAVRVNIRTGSDNKEFPSKVFVYIQPNNTPAGGWSPFYQLNLNNEMRINSDTEFGLQREEQLRGDAKLESFQSSGLKLWIKYYPNFFADAWKIENVSLTLEFKDQFGNLHPTFGRKIIVFSNAYGFLNNDYQIIECLADGSFAPLTSVIRK